MSTNDRFFSTELFEPEIQFDHREPSSDIVQRPNERVTWMPARGPRFVFAALTMAGVLTWTAPTSTTDTGPYAVLSASVSHPSATLASIQTTEVDAAVRPQFRLIAVSERDQLA